MIITQINIPKSKAVYDAKYELEELGISYNHKTQTYQNANDISSDSMMDVKALCLKLNLQYTLKEIIIKGEIDIIKNVYQIQKISKRDYFIRYRKNEEVAYSIVVKQFDLKKVALIVDYKSSQMLKFYFNQNEGDETLDALFKGLTNQMDTLTQDTEFDIGHFVHVISILLKNHSTNYTLENKLRNFKFIILEEVKKKNQNGFLCNCIPGFHYSTEFKFQGTKIISSFTNNTVSHIQEQKILKYLFKPANRHLIGVRKQPSLYNMFHGKKAKFKTRTGEAEMIISALEYFNDKIKIQVFDGNESLKIENLFTIEQLHTLVGNNK